MGATLRASRTAGFAGAALIAAAAVWAGAPSAPSLPSAAQSDGGDLLDRFLAVTEAVPQMSADDILVGEFDTSTELLGDLIGGHAQLEAVHDEAKSLFIEADDSRTPTGDLLGEGARAVLMIEDGYRRLADFELVVPFQTVDDLEVAVGTDEPRNLLQQGLDLVQQGHYRLEAVLVGLREVDKTEEQDTRYRAILEDAVEFAVHTDPAIRSLTLDPTSLQLISTGRFDPDIAGTAAARWASYTCIPRGAVDALSLDAVVEAITSSVNAGLADDCPDFPDAEVLTPEQITSGTSPSSTASDADAS